jgi:hypothetical protein
MSAGPPVVTYPLTGRSRAIVAEELSGAAEAIYLVDLAPADRAGALGRAGAVLSHDTSKELRPDDQSHSLDGFYRHEPLHDDTDRSVILALEKHIHTTIHEPRYRATVLYRKYHKKDKPYVRSVARKSELYTLYLAWRPSSWQPEDNRQTWRANQALILRGDKAER